MKPNILALSFLVLTSPAVSGGLTDPEVVPQIMIKDAIICEDKLTIKKSDYTGAFFHYSLALDQSEKKAAKSAENAIRAHAEARVQTCNPKAKAVIDRNGYAIRERNENVVVNLPE